MSLSNINFEFCIDTAFLISRLLAHQKGIANPEIRLKVKGNHGEYEIKSIPKGEVVYYMGNQYKYLSQATEEEIKDFSIKLHEVLGRMLAHQNGMENPLIILSKNGKEIKRVG